MGNRLPVSVVIPTYGRADYIMAAIESVEAAGPREVIVVDDGSPDDTAKRLAPLARENRIRYVHQANAGMAAARNAGAALAAGAYLYFLDDDDLTFPGAIEALAAELDAHPLAALACGEIVIFSGDPPAAPEMSLETRDVDHARFLRFNPIGSSGQVLIRRSAFESCGGFHPGFPSTEDWDLWLRLVEQHPARWISRPVLAYRVHGGNASRNVARMNNSSMRVARRHVRRLPTAERPRARYFTYRALREYHAPRLQVMLVEKARQRDWPLAFAAAREWVASYTSDLWATLRLKMHLAMRGRWRLRPDELPM